MLFLRKLHKWLGLIVGLQLVLWTASGSVFAWLSHHEVEAEHSVKVPAAESLGSAVAISDPPTWLDEYPADTIYELRLTSLVGEPVWRVELADRVELRRATDGSRLHLDEPRVSQLALAHYAGDGKLAALTYESTPGLETRKSGSVWQARFDDAQRTALYFSADDGHFVVARNSSWRLFDFFWMLHTMDYAGRDNFNNPLVISVATGALWLALSGLLLLTRSFRRQDFAIFGFGRARRSAQHQ
jgi:uncharacterized iron-regulated membrane protein